MADLSGKHVIICPANALRDGGRGVRFEIPTDAGPAAAFAVRYRGRVHAYLNRCAHRQTELDWAEGEFFDAEGECLVCATHGARYHPETGICLSGPCKGAALVRIRVIEAEGILRLIAG